MWRFKRLSQDSASAYAYAKTKTAATNCQATALTTAVFYFAKLNFGTKASNSIKDYWFCFLNY